MHKRRYEYLITSRSIFYHGCAVDFAGTATVGHRSRFWEEEEGGMENGMGDDGEINVVDSTTRSKSFSVEWNGMGVSLKMENPGGKTDRPVVCEK